MRNLWLMLLWSILLSQHGCLRQRREPIPVIDLLLPDSVSRFNTRDIPGGKPVILIQFSADCIECQKETESLLANMDSLANIRLYFVTFDSFDRLEVFQQHYKLQRYPNVLAGQDTRKVLARHLNDYTTPMLLVYDRNKGLRAVYKGGTSIHKLLSLINEIES